MHPTVEAFAPPRARAPSSASGTTPLTHRPIRAVAGAVGEEPPRRLPIEVVRQLVRQRSRRRRDRQLQRSRARLVHRERRIAQHFVPEANAQTVRRKCGQHALHVAQCRLQFSQIVRPPRHGNPAREGHVRQPEFGVEIARVWPAVSGEPWFRLRQRAKGNRRSKERQRPRATHGVVRRRRQRVARGQCFFVRRAAPRCSRACSA